MPWTFDSSEITFDSIEYTMDGYEPAADTPEPLVGIMLDGAIYTATTLEGHIKC